jgi:hypothetical protein
MKLLAIFLISPLLAFSQIRIDDVGDGWKGLVEQALKVIETTDTAKYNLVTQYCTQITYGLQPFSTIESDHVIILPTAEMKKGIVNDIAAAIVHESLHLYFIHNSIGTNVQAEEAICYAYELEFLKQIPGVEQFLLDHALRQYLYFSEKD